MKTGIITMAFLSASLLNQPAQAGDCWVGTVENPVTSFGDAATGKRYAALRQTLLKAEAAQRADAALNAIAKVRYQLHRHIGGPGYPGAPLSAESSVYLHKPDAWAGQCGLKPWADTVHFASLEVQFNTLRALEGGAQLTDTRFIREPEITGRNGGYPIYENRVLVLTAGGVSPFVPVTVGEYLDDWQRQLKAGREEARANAQDGPDPAEMAAYVKQLRKTDPKAAADLQKSLDELVRVAANGDPRLDAEWNELQRLRASLSPAERARPVYLTAEAMARWRFGYAKANDAGARKLVKVNPALWAGKFSEHAVRVVTLEAFLNKPETFIAEDDAHQAAARDWIKRVDMGPYWALLTK
jgi:hypothetical protein